MREYVIDCEKLIERSAAHEYLKTALELPDYYGKNLDALFDCLTELGDCTVILEGGADLSQNGGYGAKVLGVLEEAALANPRLKLEIQ